MRVGNILVVLGIYVATVGFSLIFEFNQPRVGAVFVFVGGNMIYVGRFRPRRGEGHGVRPGHE